MRILLITVGLVTGLCTLATIAALSSTRPVTPAPIIGFLHVECTQYKVCEPEPHVYYISADGRSVLSTTHNTYFEYALEWQPSGMAYAFNADHGDHTDFRHLYLADFRGTRIRRLTFDACHQDYPKWSPDGEWLAFIQTCSRDQLLMKVRADGSKPTVLAHSLDLVGAPIWTADGRFLIAPVAVTATTVNLYRFDASRFRAERLSPTAYNEARPALSPDGQGILVQRWRDFDQWIYYVPLDGGASVRVSDAEGYALAPQWSPDGQWIYYIDREGGNALVRVDRQGENRRVYADDAWEPRPDPTGRYVLYLHGLSRLAVATTDSGLVYDLPVPTGNVYQAEWVTVPSAALAPALIGAAIVGGLGLAGVAVRR